MGEEMTVTLPEGFTWEEEQPKDKNALPEGFSWQESAPEPAGVYAAEDKTPEEIGEMSFDERRQYAQDLKTETEYLQSAGFTKGALSGLTFGSTENIEALKPKEGESLATLGQLAGSFLPVSKLLNIFGGAATKLAAKSPILQKQLSHLANILGVGLTGATVKAGESLAKGEMPNADELLEHGVEWAALDTALQAAGMGGRFAASLLKRAKQTGEPAYSIAKTLANELEASGIDPSKQELISAKAFEILDNLPQESSRRIQVGEKPVSSTTEAALEAMKPKKVSVRDLKERTINDEPVNRLTRESVVLSEPYLPEKISFRQEAESLENTAISNRIESAGPRAVSDQEMGVSIKEDIESRLKKDKAEYAPLYKEAESAAENMMHIPQKTATEAGNKLIEISKIKTKPVGYEGVIKNLQTILEDAGFVIQKEKGQITKIISAKNVPVENTIELARRLNEIVDYEAVEPTVKNVLKKVARAAKQDVRDGLATNADALAAFELAEAEHARVAQKYSKDSVRKIRETEAGERISKMAEAPTTISDLREVLSPKQMQQLERETLEKLNTKNYEQSKKQLREVEKHLSEENRKIAREIVEAKNPYNLTARKKVLQDAILDDMSNALTTGQRPEKTLKMWKTTKGQNIVKETFKGSPNWPKVKGYIEQQSFNDMVSSVMSKNGVIDPAKIKTFMKDPATANNIRMMGGEDAVTFFKGLDGQVNQLERNVKLLDNLPKKSDVERGKDLLKRTKQRNIQKPKSESVAQEKIKQGVRIAKESSQDRGSKILERMGRKDYPVQSKIKDWKEWIKETLGLNAQAAMTVFGVAKLGGAALGSFTLGAPTTVATMLGYRIMSNMATSPTVRKAFTEATRHHTNPIAFVLALENFGRAVEEGSQVNKEPE